jgi:hypothetical protein
LIPLSSSSLPPSLLSPLLFLAIFSIPICFGGGVYRASFPVPLSPPGLFSSPSPPPLPPPPTSHQPRSYTSAIVGIN